LSGVVELVAEFEARGGEFAFDGQQINVQYPPEQRETLALILETLRANRDAVAAFVRQRSRGVVAPAQCPHLPPGVRLVKYAPKPPPVAVAPVSIVTDVDKFIRAYVSDLEYRLLRPEAHACAPLPEILAKLAEVGLELALE
jgi:hypothetical protein